MGNQILKNGTCPNWKIEDQLEFDAGIFYFLARGCELKFEEIERIGLEYREFEEGGEGGDCYGWRLFEDKSVYSYSNAGDEIFGDFDDEADKLFEIWESVGGDDRDDQGPAAIKALLLAYGRHTEEDFTTN